MKLLSINDKIQNDCWIDIACEHCQEVERNVSAYNDNYFWNTVLPNRKCKKCNKTTAEYQKKEKEELAEILKLAGL